jgi:beta-mannosidase
MFSDAPWLIASTPPNAVADPWQLDGFGVRWQRPPLFESGGCGHRTPNADSLDWWYQCSFDSEPSTKTLRFDGLATLAQVWLNGELILESDNMFRQYRVEVQLRERNELVICFRSLDAALAQRRPRPRWKTRLVKHQQLRWFRTTLLGRIPGWTPPTPPVGPWRAIEFEDRVVELRAWLEGTTGVVEFSSTGEGTFSVGDTTVPLRDGKAVVRIENAELWWPHTHGTPALYDCSAIIAEERIDCGRVGFRTIEQDGDFGLRVNGVPLFCRGACWTPGQLAALDLLQRAGANMVRVGGTMVYEDEAFYRRCDELGILVWQDFMFANMDYPDHDASFVASVREEATQVLRRLRRHPSVAVYCGNSEVEQQAAMVGAPRGFWRNALFAEVLPELCAELHPGTLYVPSTPSGGALPFQADQGVTHYYGVGAYRRPLEDVRRANVRFAPECLGFANIPAQDVVDEVMQGDAFAMHDPRWKERTPRDTGSPWDFEDVRDHYLRELFSLDPVELRGSDPQRYLRLSRVVTGEVMAQVFSEWRSAHSTCRGALVWFLRDLWAGAGWGILDSRSVPKACFRYLARVWQPQTVVLTDEGLNGVHAHVVNDSPEALNGTLELMLLRDGHVVIAQSSTTIEVAPRTVAKFEADAMFGAFYDTAYAYRFGPPTHDVLIATLSNGAEAFHFPVKAEPRRVSATVRAEGRRVGDGWEVALHSDRFLYAVHLDVNGLVPDDDYFHLAPGRTKTIVLPGDAKLDGFIEALNLGEAVRIAVAP